MIERDLFVLALATNWLSSVLYIGCPGDLSYTAGPGHGQIQWVRVPGLIVLTVSFLGSLIAWRFAVYEVPFGLGVLIPMVSIRQWEKSLWPGDIVVSLGKYVPTAACLLGYTVALGFTGSQTAGWEGAIGVLGGIFTINGISKWHAGGLRWFSPGGLALLVAERAYAGAPWARSARRWLVARPSLCQLLSGGTAVLETGGFLLWIPVLRVPVGLALTLALLGFWIFLGYLEIEWILLVLALVIATA